MLKTRATAVAGKTGGHAMNMAFSKTIAQVRNRTKTVTRRNINTWKTLKPGDILRAVEKAQGLKKGAKVRPLATIRVVSVREERLFCINEEEVAREGFPRLTPTTFIAQFFNGDWGQLVRRIEFEYVEPAP